MFLGDGWMTRYQTTQFQPHIVNWSEQSPEIEFQMVKTFSHMQDFVLENHKDELLLGLPSLQ